MTIANEQVYYVRPVNGDDTNEGTSFVNAWKTWQHAVDELCFTGVSAGLRSNAALFLVNEGVAYTGPYSLNGTQTSMTYGFTDVGGDFTIQGVSSDGLPYSDVYFEFDLSGFTYDQWMYGFSNNSTFTGNGILFKNLIWKDADYDTNSHPERIFYSSYDDNFSASTFVNCKFLDNTVGNTLVGFGNYAALYKYQDCIISGNNSVNTTNKGLFSAGNYSIASIRQPTMHADHCIFTNNQTTASSSPYMVTAQGIQRGGCYISNSVFYNNGYDTNFKTVFIWGQTEDMKDMVYNCIFFNNEGTAVTIDGAQQTDSDYANYIYGRKIFNCVFAYNNKAITSGEGDEPIKMTAFYNNLFYSNTSEDIPTWLSGGTYASGWGPNYTEDPDFTNGYSGDFSAPDTSPVWTKSPDVGTPLGGPFVTLKSSGTATLPTVVSFF